MTRLALGCAVLLLALTMTARADDALSPAEERLLARLVVAEAGGEGELGMALVARSVLNRVALLRSGAVAPSEYLAPRATLTAVVFARNQYQPVRDGNLDRPRSPEQLAGASRAIELARDTQALRARLRAQGVGEAALERLLRATGFRTRWAFHDSSQAYSRAEFGGHVFNGDAASAGKDTLGAFERSYGRPLPSAGLTGALDGDVAEGEADASVATAPASAAGVDGN